MRIDFLRDMIETGFKECPYCGKMISESNTIRGLCPDCAINENK